VGDAKNTEPAFLIENITIKNYFINGNKSNQTQEIGAFDIRNNGITIRGAKNVLIQNCTIINCRSGGIVIEKGSSNISIKDCILCENYFDGIAGCFSNNLTIDNCICYHNNAGGLSFDLQMRNILIKNSIIFDNDMGIFVRFSDSIKISNCIFRNVTKDLFFDQINDWVNTKPTNVTLVGNIFYSGYLNLK
jgi:parallel beta-helix repeat protein